MTFRNKNKTVQTKNRHTFKRLKRCSDRNLNNAQCAEANKNMDEKANHAQKVQLTPKDVSNILLDISMKALYNDGDKVELRLVEDILDPNKIQFNDEKSLESYWDIITNSGFVKPSIGFGNNGKISLSKVGFDVMSQFGSYMAFLQSQQNPQLKVSIPNIKQSPAEAPENDDDNNDGPEPPKA